MESQSTLVGANGTVELDSKPAVDLGVACVINPRDTEMNQTFWFNHALNDGDILRILFENRLKGFKHFFHRLVKLGLVGVSGYNFCINCVTGAHRHTFSHPQVYWPALTQSLSNGCPC